MDSHSNQSELTGKQSAVTPLTAPAEIPSTPSPIPAQFDQDNPVKEVTAPVSPAASGIPTGMVIKLFKFLEPNLDIGQMFAQFMASPAGTPQSETMGNADDEERLPNKWTEEMATSAMVTGEQGREEETKVTVGEVLAVTKVTREIRLGVEPTTKGVGKVPGQSDPLERGTRKRRYHKIVIELSEDEEDEDERSQVPLTKQPRTYKPTHPRIDTSIEGSSPQMVPPHQSLREQSQKNCWKTQRQDGSEKGKKRLQNLR